MSHGPSTASTPPRLGGRPASIRHLASLRQPATRALPAAEQTRCGTSLCLDGPIPRLNPCWTPLLSPKAHRPTGRGFYPLRRAASAILRPARVRGHGEPCAPAGAAARKPQPILTNLKGLHSTRSESVARTHRPAILASGILRSCGTRDDRESDRIKAYIENNPVKAGLVATAEDYLWSSAARKAEMNLG